MPSAGDQSGNLLWRLQNGETPDSTHQPTAAVILIGTNDLNLAITSVRRGGLGVRDLRPCAVGIADRYIELSLWASTGFSEPASTRIFHRTLSPSTDSQSGRPCRAVPPFAVGRAPWQGSGTDLHIGARTAGSSQCRRAAQQVMCEVE